MQRSAIRLMAYGPSGFVEQEVATSEDIRTTLERWPVVWIDIDGVPEAVALQQLGDLLGLHPVALEDVRSRRERAKTDNYGDHYYVVARIPVEGRHFHTEQLDLFVGRAFVLTVHSKAGGNCLEPVRAHIRNGEGVLWNAGPDRLAYDLLDSLVDSYFPVLERIGETLEKLEDEALANPENKVVRKIHSAKQELLALRRAVWPMRDALNELARNPSPLIAGETRLYLRDCSDHLFQIIDLVETYRDLGSDLMEVYLSSVSNRINEVMKVLTIIATIFIPLTFIAGLYGMNFQPQASPWNMPELKWRFGYPFALGLMAAVALGLLHYFRRRRWL
jgi:magnesium transporter